MKELTEKLKSLDEALFTEDVTNSLVEIVESKIEAAKKEALEEGFSRAQDQHKVELERIDEDHAEKLKAILEKIDTEHTEKLQTVLEHIDTDHHAKLETLVEAIDEDHANKLQLTLDAIDSDHTVKLEEVVEFYENKFEGNIVEKVSDYLDTFLEEVAPEASAVDSIKLQRLEETVTQMKKLLVVSDDFVQTEISEAIIEAKETMDEKDAQINALLAEKIQLSKQIKKNEATELLESKTSGMNPAKAAFIAKFFEGSNVEEISEKLDEAVQAFEEDQEATRQELLEQAEAKTTVANKAKVQSAKSEEELITESRQRDGNGNDPMAGYVARIKKSRHARK
jgi:hypothetical protein